ncbi:DUF1833 family protein [Marispirochaeta aestuarii]|uniref:DUF1833 family protein n=1 Tax=Marispirochaeta aestuarii TaxID=1963862 RepID=UPI002ABD505F|nr:DUF1833 family protein [Marispirochaeta aestuarii]
MRNVSAVTKKALLSSSTDKVFLAIVTIDHPDLDEPLRLVDNTVDIISGGQVYRAAGMKFTPPVEEEGSVKSSSVTFGDVDRSIVTAVRTASSAPFVSVSIIRSDNPDVYEAGPWEFTLRVVSYKGATVQGELVPDNPLQRNASPTRYTNRTFPGLFG